MQFGRRGIPASARTFQFGQVRHGVVAEEHFHGSLAFGFKVKGCHFSLSANKQLLNATSPTLFH
jgi:hypothetical protein